MKRTLSVAVMFALVMTQIVTLSAGAGSAGVITGTMRGPAGPVAGVRVNALNTAGTIVGSAMTNGMGFVHRRGAGCRDVPGAGRWSHRFGDDDVDGDAVGGRR